MSNNPLTTCLWYDGLAKEAAEFYCGIFKDSKITTVTPMVVTFELNGSRFMGLNGGPHFKFNEAISLVIYCDTQEEIDSYWDALLVGGKESQCGCGRHTSELSAQKTLPCLPARL